MSKNNLGTNNGTRTVLALGVLIAAAGLIGTMIDASWGGTVSAVGIGMVIVAVVLLFAPKGTSAR